MTRAYWVNLSIPGVISVASFRGLPPNVGEFLLNKPYRAATSDELKVILGNLTPEARAAYEKGES